MNQSSSSSSSSSFDFVETAKTYCQLRITSAASVAVVIAISLCLSAIYTQLPSNDTSGYKPVEARILDLEVREIQSSGYNVDALFEYTVAGTEYRKAIPVASFFESRTDAQDYINNAILSPTQTTTIYYDPKDPLQAVTHMDGEDSITLLLVLSALVFLVLAAIMYMLKDNAVFCGMTIAGDSVQLLKSLF